jgi:ribosome-associated protein
MNEDFMPASENALKITQLAAEAINEKLGTDIIALDMTGQLLLSEVFLIATAANDRQVDAIAEFVFEKLAEVGEKPVRREGSGAWILLDYSDLVVHIQSEELRNFYMLDRLWNDCPRIPLTLVETR